MGDYVDHDREGTDDHQEIQEEKTQLLENCQKHFDEEADLRVYPDELAELEEPADSDGHLEGLDGIEPGGLLERDDKEGEVEEEEEVIVQVPEVPEVRLRVHEEVDDLVEAEDREN